MGDEDVGPCLGFGTMCCGICLLFPASVFITGWNEQTSVCRQWALDRAESDFKKASCSDTSGLKDGDLGFVACPVDQSSMKKWTEKNLGGSSPFYGVTNLFGSGGVSAAAVQAETKMWQCEEYCARYEEHCSRRLGQASGGNMTHASNGEITIGSESRQLLSRRDPEGKAPRRLKKKEETCTKTCVAWAYRRRLSSTKLSTGFNDVGRARIDCGANYAPNTPPGGLGVSEAYRMTDPLFIGTGKKWSINSEQVQRLPFDYQVPLGPASNQGTLSPSNQPPSSFSSSNVIIQSNALYTCQPGVDSPGCLEITFKMAAPKNVAALGKVVQLGSGGASFAEEGWKAPSYWLCSDKADYNNIDGFCPSTSSGSSLTKGLTSCAEPTLTGNIDAEAENMMKNLRDANFWKTWGVRALGFLLFFCTFNACLQPIKSALGLITNMMDASTDCIPCVGGCVDLLTDIFMGVVKIILFIVAFCCGGASFLTVVMIMWFVMRPIMGGFLMIVVCCCCGGAGYLLYSNRSGKSAREFQGGDSWAEMAEQ